MEDVVDETNSYVLESAKDTASESPHVALSLWEFCGGHVRHLKSRHDSRTHSVE